MLSPTLGDIWVIDTAFLIAASSHQMENIKVYCLNFSEIQCDILWIFVNAENKARIHNKVKKIWTNTNHKMCLNYRSTSGWRGYDGGWTVMLCYWSVTKLQ